MEIEKLLMELSKLPKETEWVEFKKNYANPEEIGEYISALSNSAAYHEKNHAYMVWGIDDDSHEIVNTNFDFSKAKVGNEELESWLRRLLSDNANFSYQSVIIENKTVGMLIIDKATYKTVRFKNIDYIRIGSYKKKLKDNSAMEVKLWNRINNSKFECLYAMENLKPLEVLNLLDYNSYFDLMKTAMPGEVENIIHYLLQEKIVVKQDNGLYAITNLGALLFAKNIMSFDRISRKSVRVIQYKGNNKIEAIREEVSTKGFANGFEGLLKYIEGLLPAEEVIEGAFRSVKSVYPSIVLRELIANALIHQDLSITGTGPMIEIYDNRIEISNPGAPLIETERFIDSQARSRNEALAFLMRKLNICEERGSGWDKIALHCEINQLPAPKIDVYAESTRVTVFSYIPFNKITMQEKKWSCYMHACLKQVSGEQMTNASLRERFGVLEKNKAMISRLIAYSIEENLIKPLDSNTAPRYMCYVPFWAI